MLEVAGCHGYVSGAQSGGAAVAGRRVEVAAATRASVARRAAPERAAGQRRRPARAAARGWRAIRATGGDPTGVVARLIAFAALAAVGRAALDVDARARRARARLDGAARRADRGAAMLAVGRLPGAGASRGGRGDRPAGRADAALRARRRRAVAARADWSELAGGISRGISDLPGVRVPYRGLDDWVRTVIPLGGTALVLWPRCSRSGRGGPARLPGRRAARC